MDIIALILSIVACGFSIKAYLDSRWIEIDWNLEDDTD